MGNYLTEVEDCWLISSLIDDRPRNDEGEEGKTVQFIVRLLKVAATDIANSGGLHCMVVTGSQFMNHEPVDTQRPPCY